MDHASTHAGARHRESKAYRQRLAYWLKKGLPMAEAMRRADLKELIKQPIAATQDENLFGRKSARTKNRSDENLFGRKPAAKLEPSKSLTYENQPDLTQVVLAEANGRKPGVVINFPSFSSTSEKFTQTSVKQSEISFLTLPSKLSAFSSLSEPTIAMSFGQPLSWAYPSQSSQPLTGPSPWSELGRKLFWLSFAIACLVFLVWGNFTRMEGPFPEALFKAFFGEMLVFAAGLMRFKTMLDQAQKIIASIAGIGISLFLTQATLSKDHADASYKGQLARENLSSERQARDSLRKNLAEIAPDRIKRAEDIRLQLAAANERVKEAENRLSSLPKTDEKSHAADLIIRLLAQLSIVVAVSQLRLPMGEAS